ncbi:hypothetical protein [Geodermatophilus sp. URMC 62]|uniref:hypothetical protein n=1 Tax=Geodermatophilus sp. URMC 62 TaxID=3423414 RepID=UPI00406CB160
MNAHNADDLLALNLLLRLHDYWESPRQWVVYRERQDRVHVLGANGLFVLTVRYRPRETHDVVLERRSYPSGSPTWTRSTGPDSDRTSTRAVKAAALRWVEDALRNVELVLLADADMTPAGVSLLAAMRRDAWSLRGEALLRAATAARAAVTAL